jgi:hypothetical protein
MSRFLQRFSCFLTLTGAVGAAIVGIFFANTDLCLSKVAQASMDYLEDADLQSTAEG